MTRTRPTVNSTWVTKPRWKVSHALRADDQRPRHFGTEVGQAACGVFITLDYHLKGEPAGTNRCARCVERFL